MGARSERIESFPQTVRAVTILGDRDTEQHTEMLTGKAAEHRATIAETLDDAQNGQESGNALQDLCRVLDEAMDNEDDEFLVLEPPTDDEDG